MNVPGSSRSIEGGRRVELGRAQSGADGDVRGCGPGERGRRLSDDERSNCGLRDIIRVIERGRHGVVAGMGRVGHGHAVLGVAQGDAREPAGLVVTTAAWGEPS